MPQFPRRDQYILEEGPLHCTQVPAQEVLKSIEFCWSMWEHYHCSVALPVLRVTNGVQAPVLGTLAVLLFWGFMVSNNVKLNFSNYRSHKIRLQKPGFRRGLKIWDWGEVEHYTFPYNFALSEVLFDWNLLTADFTALPFPNFLDHFWYIKHCAVSWWSFPITIQVHRT